MADNRIFKVQPYRRVVQYGFLTVVLLIGTIFTIFVKQLEMGKTPVVSRPPGVEGFLPISALISLKYWLYTGVFNLVHPSALVLVLIIMAAAIIVKKGFCSWVCPFGLLSEYLAKIHVKLFQKPRRLPSWLDYPLRSVKYLLLFFFIRAIFFQMDVTALKNFIYSPYNRVADIKMYKFFADMSGLTLGVLLTLLLLNVLVRNFWCRYLCPYGALLGAVSWSSVFKIHRNKKSCIDCEKCTKVCPANIKVHSAGVVFSDECHACLQCVDACPVKDTLYMSATAKRAKLPRLVVPVIIVMLFVGGSSLARLLGVWQNDIGVEEYKARVQDINSPVYRHTRGQTPDNERGDRHTEKRNTLVPAGK